MKKILLVDGNSILNRAFYGLPDLTTGDGRHTNAVLGFLNIVLKIIDDINATHICVAFDVKHPTFRHEIYKEYKGTRKGMPDELREQVPLIKEVLSSMNINIIEVPGYEADDIIGTMSRKAYSDGYSVVVLSGDRDLLQLATDEILIKLPRTKGGKTTVEDFYAKDIIESYGVDPVTFIDLKGLMGDTSDNIPGVPGIGEKTASKLLIEYGSLDGIYEHIGDMKKSKMKDNLVEYRDQAYLSKTLATIKLDCNLDVDIAEMTFSNEFNQDTLELFRQLEFKSLLARFSNGKKRAFDIKYSIIQEYDDYYQLINDAKTKDYLAFEFVFSDNGIVGLALMLEDNIYIIKAINFITPEMLVSDFQELLRKNIQITCINIKNELCAIDIEENSNVFDCSLGAYLINPIRGQYDYDVIAKDYLSITLEDYKELVGKKNISLDDTDIAKYYVYEVYVAYNATPVIKQRLLETDMLKLYEEIELPCLFTLSRMEKNGIRVDAEGLKLFGDRLKLGIQELTDTIYKEAGEEFNINSTKKLGEILFEKLKLSNGKKTKTGYSTSVDVLEKISGEHPIVPMILEYRQLTKLNSTYVEGLAGYIQKDGRIHGKFNQTVTATGRISSTEPNLQNIPTRLPLGKEIRKVFIPEEGYVYLDADYSQIELRVLAHMSQDKNLIEAYNSNSDIHSITASEVFEVPINEVDELMRRRAKAVNFGIVYGISSFGLGQDLDISRKEAEGYIEKYFKTYKGIKSFLDNVVATAKANGYTTTMFNRRRPIPELASSNFMTRSFGERAAMNSPIQGSAADIIKLAMIKVDRELIQKGLKSKLVLQVHDELLIEAKLEELDEVKEILVRNMENAVSLNVPLIVDVHAGNNWLEAK